MSLGLALADALAHLHRHGLLHRDVKPASIVYVDGAPKLADLGLVAAFREAGSFVGTRGFMPPEGHQDARGDVFSLGKVLYECAWGRDRLEFPEVATDAADWPDHSQLLELNEVILKAADPHPGCRYASAAEMQADLLLVQQGRSLRRQRRLEGRLRRWTRMSLAAAVVTTLAMAGFFYQRNQSRLLRRAVDESRTHLARLHISSGLRLMEDGDGAGALVYFAAALKDEAGTPASEVNHRFRIAAARQESPRLLVMEKHDGPVEYGEFSPDGRLVLTVSRDHTARVWNAADGAPITPPLRHSGPVLMGLFSPDGSPLPARMVARASGKWDQAGHDPRGWSTRRTSV